MASEWIEFACVFETPPSEATVASLFELLREYSDGDTGDSGLNIACWDEESDIEAFEGDSTDAADAWQRRETITVTVRFEGFELRVGAETQSGPLASVPHISFRETIHPFTGSDGGDTKALERRRRRFVGALSTAGSLLDPKFGIGCGHGVTSEMIESYPDRPAESQPPLYEYNLLSAETADSVGRDRLLTAPAWYVSELDSGGVFLVVRPPPRTCSQKVEECISVANSLGMSISDLL